MKRYIIGLIIVLFLFVSASADHRAVIARKNVAGAGGAYTETFGAGANDCDGACDHTGTLEDTYMWSGDTDANYGQRDGSAVSVENTIGTYDGTETTYARGLLYFDVDQRSNAGTATVSAVTLYIYISSVSGYDATYPLKIFALLQDWSYADAGRPAGHNVYEGDNNDTVGTNEVCWSHREYSGTAWNTAGADANASGVDGDVSGDYDSTYDRGNAVVYNAYTFTAAQYNAISLNALGIDVVEHWLNNDAHNYGLLLTQIDAENVNTWNVLRITLKKQPHHTQHTWR